MQVGHTINPYLNLTAFSTARHTKVLPQKARPRSAIRRNGASRIITEEENGIFPLSRPRRHGNTLAMIDNTYHRHRAPRRKDVSRIRRNPVNLPRESARHRAMPAYPLGKVKASASLSGLRSASVRAASRRDAETPAPRRPSESGTFRASATEG